MNWKLNIQNKEPLQEPMLTYITDHLLILDEPENRDIINDMESLFSYITHLMQEFQAANKNYRKPTSMSICYCNPICCPPSIKINYQTLQINITHENRNTNLQTGN